MHPIRHPAARSSAALCLALLLVAFATAHGLASRARKAASTLKAGLPPIAASSSFFASAAEQPYSTYQIQGDGDLWPSCWADDDNLYTASGDGAAFTAARDDPAAPRPDMVVSRITGTLPQLAGASLAKDIGTNWSGPGFNRKPTGMLCIHSTLYLAFQNLEIVTFNHAPAASIARSTDHGRTWTWDAAAPMFGSAPSSSLPSKPPLFTTIFFLDFGRNSRNAIDRYVYAYGLDNNWRSQQALFLARVPADRIQTRSAWQFYTDTNAAGAAQWSADITRKQPVLLDTRIVHPAATVGGCPGSESVIAQGGVVYDKPLRRYLFTSWSCSTHELYEAPAPWGPWRHVSSNDLAPTLANYHRGQYGTSIPSKFISSDGRTVFLQSNVCCRGDAYTFSLRELDLQLAPAP